MKATVAQWPQDRAIVFAIRRKVFIDEQGVPESEEWDDHDEALGTRHYLVYDTEKDVPIATGRSLANGQIGRVCVLPKHRHSGVGSHLIITMVKALLAENNHAVFLYSQLKAIPFYEKLGFASQGDTFWDAGIEHKTMLFKPQGMALTETLFRGELLPIQQTVGFCNHMRLVTQNAFRSIEIYSHKLPLQLYNDPSLIQAFLQFIQRNAHTRIRILLHTTDNIRASSKGLVEISQRMSSHCEIKQLSVDIPKPHHSFAIFDQRVLIYFNDEERMKGYVNYGAGGKVQSLLTEFRDWWDRHSEPDYYLARVYL